MSEEAAGGIVEQVATAILNETPANYVSQSIAQAYRNAEIALAIIEPMIRADEREKIAAAIETRLNQMHSDWRNPRYEEAIRIARSGGGDE